MSSRNIFIVLAASVGLFFSSTANAHFIWLAKSSETGKVNVYFGEGPHPDKAQFLNGLKAMEVWQINQDNIATPIKFEKKTEGENGWYECLAAPSTVSVDAACEYGTFSRGDQSMWMHYSAKYSEFRSGMKTVSSGKLPLDVVFHSQPNKTTFVVTFNGKPAADCELQIVDEAGNSKEFKSDSNGSVTVSMVSENRWLVRAKLIQAVPGTVDGKAYDEKRYYCTLTMGLPSAKIANADSSDKAQPEKTATKMKTSPYPELPVGITSFGGAVAGDYIYVFGGHCGGAHDYYKSGQNATLYRLHLRQPAEWEAIHKSSGLQGLAMVEHDSQLYRVGGFAARNEQGEDQDLHSVNEFARFNAETKSWEQLQPLPEPRSSLDAVVVNNTIFVVGGWKLEGSKPKVWHETALSLDLVDRNAEWKSIKTPFKRRALSVGYQGNRLVAIGGMQDKGGPTCEVKIYDMAKQSWTDGPELPGDGSMEGFGSSCFNVGGKLIVSTYGGSVLKLNESMDAWEKMHQLETGRFFHRLLPVGNNKFVLVGGANMEIGKLLDNPVLEIR